MASYENITTETQGRVGVIRLNRPQALNALCAALVKELGQALDAFEADAEIGCMVLTGSDKAFAAGADIKEMSDKSYQDVFLKDFITVGWEKVSQVRKPIVAAVAGYALGGGCEMAMMCDFIIAADNASSVSPRSRWARSVPAARSACRASSASPRRWTWCSRPHDGRGRSRALRPGSRVVPLAELMGEALKTAQKIASMSLPATMVAKEAVNRAFETTLAERALRAPDLPCHLRLRRPRRGHGGFRREAQSRLEASLEAINTFPRRGKVPKADGGCRRRTAPFVFDIPHPSALRAATFPLRGKVRTRWNQAFRGLLAVP